MNFDSYQGELVATFRPNSRFEIVPRFNLTYQQPWQAPNLDGYFYDKSVRRLRGRLLGRWAPIDELQVTVGGDAMFDHAAVLGPIAEFETGFGQSMATSIDYQTFGAYIELFSENPIVNIAAGARYDHLSTIGGALVPRLVLLRNIGPVSLKGLFSESFRAPGIENINGGGDLRPERTRIFEFEAGVDMTPQQRLSANVFDITIEAPIAYSLDPVANVDQYRNLGRQGSRASRSRTACARDVARLEANYSFYKPTAADNTPPVHRSGSPGAVPGGTSPPRLGCAPRSGRGRGLESAPAPIILGQRYTRGPPDSTGAETATAIPATVLGEPVHLSRQRRRTRFDGWSRHLQHLRRGLPLRPRVGGDPLCQRSSSPSGARPRGHAPTDVPL